MSADISVIVPVYNTEKYLRRCLDSIIAQTVFDCMEIILINDGSTDGSPIICDEYTAGFSNIFVIHQDNGGVSAARNMGINTALGTYIGFVDSDDYIFPGMYETLLNAAKTGNADMSFCDYICQNPEFETEISFPFAENKMLDNDYIRDTIFPFMLSEWSLNSCCNKLFSKNLIEKHAVRFAAGRKIGEDRRFSIEYLSICAGVCYVRYPGYYYRWVRSSAINAPRENLFDDIIDEYKEDRKIFMSLGVDSENIEYKRGLKLLGQAVAALHTAAESLRGKNRLSAIKKIMSNRDIRECLKKQRNHVSQNSSKYEKTIYILIRLKSGFGFIALTRFMLAKSRLRRGRIR